MNVKVPEHLSAEAKKLFTAIFTEFQIDDPGGLSILRAACEAFDRAQAARAAIDQDGMTVTDKNGQKKSHPLLTVERDSRSAFLAGLKALNLDIEPLKTVGRPTGS